MCLRHKHADVQWEWDWNAENITTPALPLHAWQSIFIAYVDGTDAEAAGKQGIGLMTSLCGRDYTAKWSREFSTRPSSMEDIRVQPLRSWDKHKKKRKMGALRPSCIEIGLQKARKRRFKVYYCEHPRCHSLYERALSPLLWLLSFWYHWVQNLLLYLHTNCENVLMTLSEDKHEFYLALSPEISLLHDCLAPICSNSNGSC